MLREFSLRACPFYSYSAPGHQGVFSRSAAILSGQVPRGWQYMITRVPNPEQPAGWGGGGSLRGSMRHACSLGCTIGAGTSAPCVCGAPHARCSSDAAARNGAFTGVPNRKVACCIVAFAAQLGRWAEGESVRLRVSGGSPGSLAEGRVFRPNGCLLWNDAAEASKDAWRARHPGCLRLPQSPAGNSVGVCRQSPRSARMGGKQRSVKPELC